MNPETRLVWHPVQAKLKDLRVTCLLDETTPPHWMRIENIAGSGFPDLWWGWGGSGQIELKHRGAAPVGVDTPCAIESISPNQRLFWRQAAEAGSSCFVLTRVGREWFLHTADWARRFLGLVPIQDMRNFNYFAPAMSDGPRDACFELPDARTILLLCGANP